MRLNRSHTLSVGVSIHDLAFWDDDTLLVTTRAGDLFRVDARQHPREPELLYRAKQILAPVAHTVGMAELDPAAGGYPRVAASSRAGVAIVNTHDLVLVACPVQPMGQPRLISLNWGLYYPTMTFSADGSRFCAASDGQFVFDTRTWQSWETEDDEGAFHPRDARLLCFGWDGQARWRDMRNLDSPEAEPLGAFTDPETGDSPLLSIAGIFVDASAERCVVALCAPARIEVWQLSPFRRLMSRPVEAEDIKDVVPAEHRRWFALETEMGTRIWDTETCEPMTALMTSARNTVFSPSGNSFITGGMTSTNPHPAHPTPEAPRELTLWRLEE